MRKNGPIGVVPDSLMTLSTSSTSSPSSSVAFQISDAAELRIRFTTKPGTSPQRTGGLADRLGEVEAAWSVSSEVSSPSITSIRRMIDAG